MDEQEHDRIPAHRLPKLRASLEKPVWRPPRPRETVVDALLALPLPAPRPPEDDGDADA